MEFPTDIKMYEAVIGAFLPLLIAVLTSTDWPAYAKRLLLIALALLASVGHALYAGALDMSILSTTFLKIVFISATTYSYVWKWSGTAEYIERRINVRNKK